jgi:hypothetical protein
MRIWSKASRSLFVLHSIVMVSFVLFPSSVKTSVATGSGLDGSMYPNGEYEPLGRGDFSIDACERVSLSLGTAIDPTKGSVRPQIDFANGERHAARVPPMCDVFGLSPGLEDHSAPPLAGVIPACVFLASAWVGTWLLYPNWLTSLSEHTSSTATGQQAHRETAMISRS